MHDPINQVDRRRSDVFARLMYVLAMLYLSHFTCIDLSIDSVV